VATPPRGIIAKDLVHILTYKMLQIPLFSSMEILALDFAPIQVPHLASKMLEGKLPMPSLEVVQAINKPSTKDLVNL